VSRTFVAAGCLALLLSACGDSGKNASATTRPAQEAAPAPTSVVELDANRCVAMAAPEPDQVSFKAPRAKLSGSRTYVATIDTNCGAFEITLDAKRAPRTGASFKFLADEGFYNGLMFHRIVPGFVIQGGDPLGTGEGGPGYSVVEKPSKRLVYRKYTVAMAKAADEGAGSSGSQFFVCTGTDCAQLPPDYALLGKVTKGKAVVDKIGAIITDPRTDFPENPVVMKSVTVKAT
jgi:peptidyl-prolyl cis-trans isomerase B (cyclophilin B)